MLFRHWSHPLLNTVIIMTTLHKSGCFQLEKTDNSFGFLFHVLHWLLKFHKFRGYLKQNTSTEMCKSKQKPAKMSRWTMPELAHRSDVSQVSILSQRREGCVPEFGADVVVNCQWKAQFLLTAVVVVFAGFVLNTFLQRTVKSCLCAYNLV